MENLLHQAGHLMNKDGTRSAAGTQGGISRHVPALDGVGGLAILLVLVHHIVRLGPSEAIPVQMAKGIVTSLWLGVDLFFVLSGLLITGILLDSKTERGYFRIFYARRFLRIFPLYYGFLGLLFLGAAFGASRGCEECPSLLDDQLWFWGYATNLLVLRSGWTELPFNTGPLWSLAVEEQFYLIWPAVVLWLSAARLSLACAILIGLSPVARLVLYLSGTPDTVTYTLSIVRLDGFAVGGLIALALRNELWAGQLRRVAVAVGILSLSATLSIAWYLHGLDRTHVLVQSIGYTVIALGFGALIAYVLTSKAQSRVQGLFTHGALTRLGLYSYGLYVIHYPLVYALESAGFTLERIRSVVGIDAIATLVHTAGIVSVALVLAALSWHLYEQPILRLKSRFAYAGSRRRPTPASPLSIRETSTVATD